MSKQTNISFINHQYLPQLQVTILKRKTKKIFVSKFFGVNDYSVAAVMAYCEPYADRGIAFQNGWSRKS